VPSSWTQSQTFRIVIILSFATVDKTNINAVLSALSVNKTEIRKIDM
jgi:hypothetical protein